jgi:hypothetical protein
VDGTTPSAKKDEKTGYNPSTNENNVIRIIHQEWDREVDRLTAKRNNKKKAVQNHTHESNNFVLPPESCV